MRRLLAVLAILALVAVPAWASMYVNNAVNATQANTAITFVDSDTSAAFYPTSVLVINDAASANEVYVKLWRSDQTVATATTSHTRIEPGESMSWTFNAGVEGGQGAGYKAIALICAAGETATVRVMAK